MNTYAVLNGDAGGTEQIIGFKDGEIGSALAGATSHSGNETTAASATVTLSDNTRITFMGLTKVDGSIFG